MNRPDACGGKVAKIPRGAFIKVQFLLAFVSTDRPTLNVGTDEKLKTIGDVFEKSFSLASLPFFFFLLSLATLATGVHARDCSRVMMVPSIYWLCIAWIFTRLGGNLNVRERSKRLALDTPGG